MISKLGRLAALLWLVSVPVAAQRLDGNLRKTKIQPTKPDTRLLSPSTCRPIEISLASDGSKFMEAMLINSEEKLFHALVSSHESYWSGFNAVDGVTTGSNGANTVDCAITIKGFECILLRPDGTMFHGTRYPDGSWNGFNSMSFISQAKNAKAISVASNGSKYMEVMMINESGRLYHALASSHEGYWSGFHAVDSATSNANGAENVDCAMTSTGFECILVRADGTMFHGTRYPDGSWNGFNSMSFIPNANNAMAISLSSDGGENMEVMMITNSGRLYHALVSKVSPKESSWSGFNPVDSATENANGAHSVDCATTSVGYECILVRPDGSMFHGTRYPNGAWNGFNSMDGIPNGCSTSGTAPALEPAPASEPAPAPEPASENPFDGDDGVPIGTAPDELTWADIVAGFEDFDGSTGKVRVLYIDVDQIKNTKAYGDNPYWWQYYRTFWDEDGNFVNRGREVQQGTVGRDCTGLDWYPDATKQYTVDGLKKYSTRYCHPVSRKKSNQYCSVYMTNHYRGPITNRLLPGLDTRGPTYYDTRATNRPGVNMNFEIHIDEYIELSRETFSCYATGTWRHVIAGEVTPDGYGIVPQSNEPEGSYPNPYYKWLFILPSSKRARLASCKPGTCPAEPLMDTGYVRIVDPPLTAVSTAELFRRALETHALGGVEPVSMTNKDKAAEGLYFLVKVNGKWTRSVAPGDFFKMNNNLDWLRTCNCLTLNGSGNHFEDGINNGIAMAEELGRDFSIHYYMPTSMGFDAYENHDANTRIPEMIVQMVEWAAQNNEQLDIRGHSWSSWLLWRACGEAPSKCSNVDLTTYAPATLWDNWGEIFYDMYDFKGNGNVVYGSNDFLSIPSLSGVLDNTGSLGNIKFDRLPGTGHKIKDILQAHNP